VEEAFKFYHLTKGGTKEEELIDRDMEVKHRAETINFLRENKQETSTIHIFTEGR
jgi:hypothetical protein